MNIFRDYYNNEVKLSFSDHPFSKNPKHVWVICRFKNDWLLTKHKDRGFEFPGGKVENGETASQAAIREVLEETGGMVDKLTYIGQYIVAGKADTIIKNVYFASISNVSPKETYFETAGPVLLSQIPENVKHNDLYSFIMKDGVLPHCLGYLTRNKMILGE